MILTDAWVLKKGSSRRAENQEPTKLTLEKFEINEINEHEVLTEPLCGCWEGNMTHALQRTPIDICRFRREEKVVVGNAGVVRVIQTGTGVKDLQEGDVCMVFGNAKPDSAGYMELALAYDAPGTMGVLAKKSKFHRRSLLKLPKKSRFSYQQWAAFSLRYVTAWSNWKLAYGTFRLQMSDEDCREPYVVGGGGGVSFAQLQLANLFGCKSAMTASQDSRIQELKKHDIVPIDRREFPNLYLNPERYSTDRDYRRKYIKSEKIFLEKVREIGNGQEVSIFLDHIGAPVYKATLKALGRQGVITSCGWKEGAEMTNTMRTVECIKRRQHINTHYARYSEGLESVEFAEKNGWGPTVDMPVYDWGNIPQLADDYEKGKIASYFPLFQINPE